MRRRRLQLRNRAPLSPREPTITADDQAACAVVEALPDAGAGSARPGTLSFTTRAFWPQPPIFGRPEPLFLWRALSAIPQRRYRRGAQYGVSSYSAFAHQLEEAGAASPSALYSVGMDVSYEVDLFGRIHRAVQAAAADYDATRAAEDITRVTVAGETTRAYLNACAYAQEYAVAEKSLELVTQTYDVTVKEEQFGSVSAFDVARARQVVEQTRGDVAWL